MKKTSNGSCHCGAVRFEADIDLAHFRLLSGAESLGDYQFGRKVIHHRFCTKCGVQTFSQANEQLALRVNCLDGADPKELIAAPVKYFDMLHDDAKSPPAETRHL